MEIKIVRSFDAENKNKFELFLKDDIFFVSLLFLTFYSKVLHATTVWPTWKGNNVLDVVDIE